MTVAVVVFVLVVVVVGVVVVAVVPMAVVRFVVVELAVVVLVVVVVAVVVVVVVVNVVCKVVVVEYRLASVEGRQETAVYRQVEVERSQNVVVVAVVGVGNILIQRHSLAGVDNGFDHRRVLIIVLRLLNSIKM